MLDSLEGVNLCDDGVLERWTCLRNQRQEQKVHYCESSILRASSSSDSEEAWGWKLDGFCDRRKAVEEEEEI